MGLVGLGTKLVGKYWDEAVGLILKNSDELYDTAKSGGRYSGMIENFKGRSIEEIEKNIESYEKQIVKHKNKIENPQKYVSPEKWDNPKYRAGIIEKWEKDISNNTERLAVMKGLLNDKKSGKI